MQVIRCPECGNRLDSGYCPMCMKRVPLPAQKKETAWQQRRYTSSRREEDHECIRFDEVKKTTRKNVQTPNVLRTLGNARQQRRQAQNNKKQVTAVAVVVAIISLLSSVADLFESVSEAAPEPEYNYEAFLQAGEDGAENVPAIQPVEIYNSNDIQITVDSAGLYYDDYAVTMTITNNADQDVTVSTNLLCINDYMFPYTSLYAPVEAGDSAQCYMQISAYDLEEAGIDQVAQIRFCLDIYDSDEYTQIDYTDLITLETDAAGDYEQPVDDTGWELYNEGGIRILLRNAELSHYDDYTMELFIENNTDQTVCLSDSGIYLNGEETTGMLWTSLLPNSHTIDSVYIYDMEEWGISDSAQIKEVSIDLHAEYMEDVNLEQWIVDETVNSTITFTPAELTE